MRVFTSVIMLCIVVTVLSICSRANAQSLSSEYPEQFQISVSNPLNRSRENVMVTIPVADLRQKIKAFNDRAFVVLDGEKEIPSQYIRNDQLNAGIIFVLDQLDASETKQLIIRYHPSATKTRTYPKRTQAELSYKQGGKWKNREYIGGEFKNTDFLRVPPEHKDHSWFIRYEGPGWESDKVGYRFYLDQRNATDVFGKVTPEMVLQKVGLDGFDSYHEMQSWGMDVMKVGKSLGVGSLGSVVNSTALRVEKTDSVHCRIVENGDVYSSILTNYFGWNVLDKKHNVQSQISIHAGTRLSRQHLTITNNIDNFATGIVKDQTAPVIIKKGNAKEFGYIATYGKQSLNSDQLGLAIFFNANDLMGATEDEFSHIVKLRPSNGRLTYYFLGAWEKESGGIKDQTQFENYLTKVAAELAIPVKVLISTKR